MTSSFLTGLRKTSTSESQMAHGRGVGRPPASDTLTSVPASETTPRLCRRLIGPLFQVGEQGCGARSFQDGASSFQNEMMPDRLRRSACSGESHAGKGHNLLRARRFQAVLGQFNDLNPHFLGILPGQEAL